MTSVLVACVLSAFTIIETPTPPLGYTAAYLPATHIIYVLPEYRWDAGVMYHELGHHVYYQCDANEHPYWMGKPERFADAWAEHVLGWDVPYYTPSWLDALWMDWWMELRSFTWR